MISEAEFLGERVPSAHQLLSDQARQHLPESGESSCFRPMAVPLEEDAVLSPLMAIIAVLKGIVGLCALTLPAALAKTNLALGLVLLVLVAFAEGLGTYRLAECSMKLEQSGKQVDSAQGLGPLGQVSLEVFGLSGYRLCAVNVMLAQFGLACAYTRTVGNTLQQSWGIPSFELYLGLAFLLCLQSLGRSAVDVWW
eukprot:Skav224132  [mRNA]  locus=scaffold462:48399:50381:- [translate_table: standard]